jgi:hypothetical protein
VASILRIQEYATEVSILKMVRAQSLLLADFLLGLLFDFKDAGKICSETSAGFKRIA